VIARLYGKQYNPIMLCEKNFPKFAKIWKNEKNEEIMSFMISICYRNYRRLGNSEVMTSNP
jgi:hypothetical protein